MHLTFPEVVCFRLIIEYIFNASKHGTLGKRVHLTRCKNGDGIDIKRTSLNNQTRFKQYWAKESPAGHKLCYLHRDPRRNRDAFDSLSFF